MLMRDVDIINKAMEDVQAELHRYVEPGPRNPEAVSRRCRRRSAAVEPRLWTAYRCQMKRRLTFFDMMACP